jgi:hypothetical protein
MTHTIAKYEFRFDENFLIDSYRRYLSLSHHKWWLIPTKTIAMIGMLLLLGFALSIKQWPLVILFAFLSLCLAAGNRFDLFLTRRRFRKSPFCDQNVKAVVSEDAYLAEDAQSKVELKWSVVTKARRFSDGFLIVIGQHNFYWLPHKSISGGNIEDVHALLGARVGDYGAAGNA